MGYEPRLYRSSMSPDGLTAFRVVRDETDLHIHARSDLRDVARGVVCTLRESLEAYIATHPRFGESFVPCPVDETAPAIARKMASAAEAAGVGPMAAVAGAFAEAVARELAVLSDEVIVENGGDVFIVGRADRTVGVWAGPDAPRVGVVLKGMSMPCAVATSSGTIGPSVSMGRADAVTVVSHSGALADAAASALGNLVRRPDDLPKALEAARAIRGVTGALVVASGEMGAWGEIELTSLSPELM